MALVEQLKVSSMWGEKLFIYQVYSYSSLAAKLPLQNVPLVLWQGGLVCLYNSIVHTI